VSKSGAFLGRVRFIGLREDTKEVSGVVLPENLAMVAAILLAVVPGFVATSVWAKARTWKGPEGDLRTILKSFALSLVVQLAVSPLTLAWLYPVRGRLEDHSVRLAVWFALVVLVVPTLGGLAIGKVTDFLANPGSPEVQGHWRRRIARVWPASGAPSIWDWLFAVRPPLGSFVVVEFDDGSRVAGVFAEGSMALTSPEQRGLYLVSEWQLNEAGDVVRPLPDTAGVMIMNAEHVRLARILRGESRGLETDPEEGIRRRGRQSPFATPTTLEADKGSGRGQGSHVVCGLW
jgi:hypothetical protein